MQPEQRAEMGRRARERVVAEFDEGIVLRAYRRQVESFDPRRTPGVGGRVPG